MIIELSIFVIFVTVITTINCCRERKPLTNDEEKQLSNYKWMD